MNDSWIKKNWLTLLASALTCAAGYGILTTKFNQVQLDLHDYKSTYAKRADLDPFVREIQGLKDEQGRVQSQGSVFARETKMMVERHSDAILVLTSQLAEIKSKQGQLENTMNTIRVDVGYLVRLADESRESRREAQKQK